MTYYDCPEHGALDVWGIRPVDVHYGCGQAISRQQHPDYSTITMAVCPEHGELVSFRYVTTAYMCRACGQRCKVREIAIRTPRGGKPGHCGAACLNGKRSCDCECRGRCHGAKECRCGVAT